MKSGEWSNVISVREQQRNIFEQIFALVQDEKKLAEAGNFDELERRVLLKKKNMSKLNKLSIEIREYKKIFTGPPPEEVLRTENRMAELIEEIGSVERSVVEIIEKKLNELKKDIGSVNKQKKLSQQFGAYKKDSTAPSFLDQHV